MAVLVDEVIEVVEEELSVEEAADAAVCTWS